MMICLKGFGQTISNVDAWQEGNAIVISYTLTGHQNFFITAKCSIDGGANYFILNQVSGDIGEQFPGKGKKIYWDVLNEIKYLQSDNVVFSISTSFKQGWGNGISARELSNQYYEKALSTSTDFPGIIEKLYHMASQLGNEYAYELMPQIHLRKANEYLNMKRFAEAAAEYQKAIDIDGENGVAWLRLGMCKSNSGDVEGAVAAFNKASEFGQKAAADKQLGNIYGKAAQAAYKAKNFAGTLENVLKANEYGFTKLNVYGGMAAFNLKKYDQCISLLEGDSSTNAKYYLARAYEAKGNNAKACENYKAIATDKNFGAYATSKVGTLCK